MPQNQPDWRTQLNLLIRLRALVHSFVLILMSPPSLSLSLLLTSLSLSVLKTRTCKSLRCWLMARFKFPPSQQPEKRDSFIWKPRLLSCHGHMRGHSTSAPHMQSVSRFYSWPSSLLPVPASSGNNSPKMWHSFPFLC